MSEDTEDIKKKIRRKPKKEIPTKEGLSTSTTLLNLGCSGNPSWGLLPGNYYLFVGDSSSGKTIITLSILAEAAKNPAFDKYKLIHDNAENGALMDMVKFYGQKAFDRIEPPDGTKAAPVYSSSVEGFYRNVDNALTEGPCIYLLDSSDVLSTEEDQKAFRAKTRRREEGEASKGSYGTSKAKFHSSGMRIIYNKIVETGSILFIISQTRTNIGFGSQFNPKTRSGGLALTFFAALEMWTSIAGHIKKRVRGAVREQGIYCKIRIKKNRISGKDRTVIIPIYHSAGIDDIGSLVDYLVEEGQWKQLKEKGERRSEDTSRAQIETDLGFTGNREEVVQYIEKNGLEKDVKLLAAEVWKEIEDQCSVTRKKRYE